MGMREEFEAWAMTTGFEEHHFGLRADGEYRDYDVRRLWHPWQASRAAIGNDRKIAIDELSSIPGIGYLKASQLYDAGVRWVHTK